MLTQKGQRSEFTISYCWNCRHENWDQWWDIIKLSYIYRSRTCQASWFSKPFHTFMQRGLRVLVLAVKMHFPSQPDTGRSDIIIYGQSCWQRNANIDLEAQSVTKLLSSLSHEAQWCLYGNFMRPLKQDIGHWNVIFTAALFHNHPRRWWTFDNGKRVQTACVPFLSAFQRVKD